MGTATGDVTGLLERWSRGDREAFKELVPLVYGELRLLAEHHLRRERGNHTLQPTALVHEAYLRMSGLREMRIQSRAHFYGVAAGVMRRVLVDHARHRRAMKRGGPVATTFPLEEVAAPAVDMRFDLVALNDVLERLASFAPNQARVVELRYFGGLSVEETALVLEVAPATVKQHWKFARTWLYRALERGDVPADGGGTGA